MTPGILSTHRLTDLTTRALEALLRDDRIGELMLDRIRNELACRKGEAADAAHEPKQAQPRSTNPRASMTKVELRMADELDMRVRIGELSTWWFECLTFKTGAGTTTYRPDFVALRVDGKLEVIETKGGHTWDDSKEKFKAAAALYPFVARWRMLQWKDGEWRTVYDFTSEASGGV